MASGLAVLINAPRRWMRGLYDWTVRWSERPQALAALFLIAFAESSFFPIPPDVLLIAIVAGSTRQWLKAALACTLGSLLGASLGYAIGYTFMATIGQAIVDFYQAQRYWTDVVAMYNGPWGLWFLAGAAFTPIPYKVATIAAGATHMPYLPFLLISSVGRAGRFFLVATILRIFGPPVRRTLERHFDLAAFIFMVLLVGGFVVIRLL